MSEHIHGVDVTAVDVESDTNSEKVINWEEEANAIMNDVKAHVAAIEIARKLPCSASNIYLNIRTIEDAEYCVHVSSMGFRVVAHAYDTIDADKVVIGKEGDEDNELYETPYALLDKISPRYVESFGNQLCKQLLHLQQMRTQFNEEDEENLIEEENDDRTPSTPTPTP